MLETGSVPTEVNDHRKIGGKPRRRRACFASVSPFGPGLAVSVASSRFDHSFDSEPLALGRKDQRKDAQCNDDLISLIYPVRVCVSAVTVGSNWGGCVRSRDRTSMFDDPFAALPMVVSLLRPFCVLQEHLRMPARNQWTVLLVGCYQSVCLVYQAFNSGWPQNAAPTDQNSP